MNEPLFDLKETGKYFTPPAIVEFLVSLTSPLPNEEALGIGLNPLALIPYIKQSLSS